MTKNTRTVSLAVIGAIVLLALTWLGVDTYRRRQGTHDCGDGPRPTIYIRDFTTEYSAYSVELEANIADKAKVSAKLSPVLLQQLSEAIQNTRESRLYVVAGYNSCAVTKIQYLQFENRFKALDSLAHEINELAEKPSLPPQEMTRLSELIKQYGDLARKAGTQ